MYDTNGYLTDVLGKDTGELFWHATKRDGENRIVREKLGNGINTYRAYKWQTGYLDTVETGPLDGSAVDATVQNDVYVFDDLGNLTSRSQSADNSALVETFGYDSLNRLTGYELNNGSVSNEVSLAYNAIGNITWRSDRGVYNYNPSGPGSVRPHAVTSIDGFFNNRTYVYNDNNGNMTVNGTSLTITWNAANLPQKMVKGSFTECFLYTPERERVRRSTTTTCADTTTVYLNPRIDTGGTFEKAYLGGGVVESTSHIYAEGRVIGAVVQRVDPAQTITTWNNDLSANPEANPPPTPAPGLTMPATDPLDLIAWSNTSAPGDTTPGRLAVKTPTTGTAQVMVTGTRGYLDEGVVFKAEIRTTTNALLSNGFGGRFIQFGVNNGGSAQASWLAARRHQVYLYGNVAYASVIDGQSFDGSGNLAVVNVNLNYPIEDNTTYVAEVETTATFSTLYLYKQGQTRQDGVRHSVAMDWKGPNGTLTRKLRILATGTASAANTTYIDNLREEPVAVANRRYFHTDHLGSVVVTTNELGAVLERLSYDPWGKRRHADGRDEVKLTQRWEVDFDGAPPTSNAGNVTGIQLPTSDLLTVFEFDDTLDRLVVNRRHTTGSATSRVAKGVRVYEDFETIQFRGRVLTSATQGSGRYITFQAHSQGTTADNTLRRFGIKIVGSSLYAIYLADPAAGGLQTLLSTTQKYIEDNTAYIVEIYTDKEHNVLYVYPEGGVPADGWSYTLDHLVWEAGADKKRYLRIEGQETANAVANQVYVDQLSETQWEPISELTAQSTRHGFTGHEHLDSVDFVHMNGRVYDPQSGRFLSPDPNIFHPDNLQDFNRYSYVQNNPLSLTDPSGFTWANRSDDAAAMRYGLNAGLQFANTELQSQIAKGSLFAGLSNPTTGLFTQVGPNSPFTGMSEGPFQQVASSDYSFEDFLRDSVRGAVNVGTGYMDGVTGIGANTLLNEWLGYDTSYQSTLSYQAGLTAGAGTLIYLSGGTAAPAVSSGLSAGRIPSVANKGATFPAKELPNFVGAPSQTLVGGGEVLYGVRDASSRSLWWTRTRPTGPLQWRMDQAVLPEWNKGTLIETLTVPRGQSLVGFEGAARAQGPYLGGGNQIYIPSVPKSWSVVEPW